MNERVRFSGLGRPLVIAAACFVCACGSSSGGASSKPSPSPSPVDRVAADFRHAVTQAYSPENALENPFEMSCQRQFNAADCRAILNDTVKVDNRALDILANAKPPSNLVAKAQALHDGLVRDVANNKAALAALDTGDKAAITAAMKNTSEYYVKNILPLFNELQM